MKNQRKIYEALLAGEALQYCGAISSRMKLNKDGELMNVDSMEIVGQSFNSPELWDIHKEPKWYENIPEGGVLCWVKDTNTEKAALRAIDAYDDTDKTTYPFRNAPTGACWRMANPLTKQEIRVFMDNVSEDI